MTALIEYDALRDRVRLLEETVYTLMRVLAHERSDMPEAVRASVEEISWSSSTSPPFRPTPSPPSVRAGPTREPGSSASLSSGRLETEPCPVPRREILSRRSRSRWNRRRRRTVGPVPDLLAHERGLSRAEVLPLASVHLVSQ